MTRKPRMATGDDRARRFAAYNSDAEEFLDLLAVLRRYLATFPDPRIPDLLRQIDELERQVRAARIH